MKTRSYIYITTFNIKVHTISILVDIDVRVSVRGNTCRLVTTSSVDTGHRTRVKRGKCVITALVGRRFVFQFYE